jgi:hypothetical protein
MTYSGAHKNGCATRGYLETARAAHRVLGAVGAWGIYTMAAPSFRIGIRCHAFRDSPHNTERGEAE